MGLRRFTTLVRRLVWPRRTARRRLVILYGGLFLLSGILLLGITGVLTVRSSQEVARSQAPAQSQQGQLQARIQQLELQLASQASRQHADVEHELLVGSAIGLGVMAVMSVLLGMLAAGRVLRPLREMTETTRRISADNLHERLSMPGPHDELKDLADTIDGLLERLEGAFAAQRRFVANASHELRTPLATMRASLDVAVAKPDPVPPQTLALAGRLRTELDQVDRLLEGLLTLARAQHGAQPLALPDAMTLALDDVVAAALAARADAIAARNLTVRHVTGPQAAWVTGSQPLLRRMADNIVDNAIKHNQHGGWIQLTTHSEPSAHPATTTPTPFGGPTGRLSTLTPTSLGGPAAWLVVETGGQVFDQRQVDELGHPFRRLAADRTGSDVGAGLGLSIVAAIASAHGGTLTLQARERGGLRVIVALPVAVPVRAGAPA
jgi:signal transduction histidine kinase